MEHALTGVTLQVQLLLDIPTEMKYLQSCSIRFANISIYAGTVQGFASPRSVLVLMPDF